MACCRDVFNEKPTLEDTGPGEGGEEKDSALVLPRGAVMHTTKGDITLKLFPEECPKTIENFSTHAKNGAILTVAHAALQSHQGLHGPDWRPFGCAPPPIPFSVTAAVKAPSGQLSVSSAPALCTAQRCMHRRSSSAAMGTTVSQGGSPAAT